MDFVKGEVYKVVLSHTMEGELFPYPMILVGKCLMTSPQYITLLDPQTNMVKGFKRSQMAKSEPYDCTSKPTVSTVPSVSTVSTVPTVPTSSTSSTVPSVSTSTVSVDSKSL